jgi:hypothetical protein
MSSASRSRTHRSRRATLVVIATLALLSVAASNASAGTYTVSGTCGFWDGYNNNPANVAVYAACPTLVTRNVYGNFTSPVGVEGGWVLNPPPGASISSFTTAGNAAGFNGWQATLYAGGQTFMNCPGPGCAGGSTAWNGIGGPTYGATPVARLRCGSSSGCTNGGGLLGGGNLNIERTTVTIADGTPPAVSVAGGSAAASGWRAGAQSVDVSASDNVGIQEDRVLIDGARVSTAPRSCNYGLKAPCPNGVNSLVVPTGGFSDGVHTLSAQAVDAAQNVGGSAGVTIYTDNTPPTQALDVALDGGGTWRTENKFKVTWRNPPQRFAPIVAAEYQLCPTVGPDASASARAQAQRECVRGSRTGNGVTRIDNLSVPKENAWSLNLWLRDSAGNQQAASAVKVDGVNYDITPPKSVAFIAQDPQDPARLRVRATDEGSGIRSGSIEVRRDGENVWRPLPTEVTDYGLSAFMDDETLPKGVYFMRARAADAASLEQSSDRWEDGNPATLKLPIRLPSRLVAGRHGKRICHRIKRGRHRHRVCRRRLVTKPRVRVGRSTRLFGRLTINRQAAAASAVEVWRQLDGSADWKRLGTITTSKSGRFSYKARRGPARTIRFRYPGAAMIRGRNADVRLRVKASTSIAVNHRSVITGEYVTFRGHLRGGWLPTGGVLVELQVRTRGKWRTFAQPRAPGSTGRWVYRYRFETIRGRARFRFRARIRRQRGYPFTTGHSRQIPIRVRGL